MGDPVDYRRIFFFGDEVSKLVFLLTGLLCSLIGVLIISVTAFVVVYMGLGFWVLALAFFVGYLNKSYRFNPPTSPCLRKPFTDFKASAASLLILSAYFRFAILSRRLFKALAAFILNSSAIKASVFL